MTVAQRTKLRWGTMLLVSAGLLHSCLKPESFPVQPSIEFLSFEQFGDSASLTIAFTDGDGDIGLATGDTFPPYDVPPYYFNLFLGYEELRNGTWTEVPLLIPLNYRIPVITPTGQNKTLEGEIAVALQPFPTDPGSPYDTVRYSVKMVDRALNESNTVLSNAVITP